jgi:disulfide bond formation protein DsbB
VNTFPLAALFTDSVALQDDTLARLAINITTFLTILCWIFIVAFAVSRLTSSMREKFREVTGNYVFFLVWLVPCTAMFFSLFMSDVLGWTPCRLCWYQRIFMYSLAVLMLVYYFKRSAIIRKIGYVLASIGPIISFYHVGVERAWFTESASCDPSVPCSAVWFTSLEFLTLAGMALTGFITILILLYMTSTVGDKVSSGTSEEK